MDEPLLPDYASNHSSNSRSGSSDRAPTHSSSHGSSAKTASSKSETRSPRSLGRRLATAFRNGFTFCRRTKRAKRADSLAAEIHGDRSMPRHVDEEDDAQTDPNVSINPRLLRQQSVVIRKEDSLDDFMHEDSDVSAEVENNEWRGSSRIGHMRHMLKNGLLNLLAHFVLDVERHHAGEHDRAQGRGRYAPRLLDRNAPSHQTLGRMNIHRVKREQDLFLADLFHLVIEMSPRQLCFFFVCAYTSVVTFFAFFFLVAAGRGCGIGVNTYIDALFLSVETMLTIGYGVPDPYFHDCSFLVVVLLTECLLSVLLGALLTGIIYQRISRGQLRASTILFTDRAVLRTINGITYFMFQVCEMRRTQLIECHIRCYLFSRPRPDPMMGRISSMRGSGQGTQGVVRRWNVVEQRQMRLEQPDDSLGAMLLLVLPAMVVHRCDEFSPLRGKNRLPSSKKPLDAMRKPFSLLPPVRTSDCETGQRDSVWCEACGESFQHLTQLRRHVESMLEVNGIDKDASHASMLTRLESIPEPTEEDARAEIEDFLDDYDIEVVCLLEGIDAATSSAVQARMSYTVDDIVWDHDFAPCTCTEGDEVTVDFSHYHKLMPEVKNIVSPQVSPNRNPASFNPQFNEFSPQVSD